jgi:SAM-dependent methyltransferase
MARYHDAAHRRLVYIHQRATAAFWEEQWATDQLERIVTQSGRGYLVVPTTQRYLPPPARVLEGGCGRGAYVYALRQAGYDCLGLDFAGSTLRQVRRVAPGLPLVAGDVFCLPLADESLDGYWSLGVIEHFWNGYQPIADEMRRVLRPGGYLFLTHPAMSPLRRLRARLGAYRPLPDEQEMPGFYQFALDPAETRSTFEASGFRLAGGRSFEASKGLAEELGWLRRPLAALGQRSQTSRRALLARRVVERATRSWAGHMRLFVFQKQW